MNDDHLGVPSIFHFWQQAKTSISLEIIRKPISSLKPLSATVALIQEPGN